MVWSVCKKTQNNPNMDKKSVQMLLKMAQTNHERECLRYAIYKSSGMSETGIRRVYGFENMNERSSRIEKTISQAEDIRETVDEIATMQDRALLLIAVTVRLNIQQMNQNPRSCTHLQC